ncbi:hypothetical protein ABZ446_01075 [Streptomyces sp. NPDC005813]|uniref:hypothetical protein n=1 Tax=Streptomyces sp. NPDC005813 TaxID=3155592 RepID=UPI0033FCFCE8
MISGGWPDGDATVLRYGLRRLLMSLPIVLLLIAGGVMGVWIAVEHDGIGAGWIPLGMLAAMGVAGVILLVSRWRARHWITAFDSTGFWWMRGKEMALIRWDSLAGAGIHWARGSKTVVFTVELCPKDEIDRDDPLLWKFVRDTEPLGPGLPRLRYRIDVGDSHKAYEKAFRQWAPGLWFGRREQPMSYLGGPDHEGHRERTGAAGRGPREPLAFETVEIGDSVVVHRAGVLIRRRLAAALVMVSACAWAVPALLPEQGHGAVAVVREVIAAVLVALVGWGLLLHVRGVRLVWNQRVTVDATGVHVTRRGRSATVPWDSLAGVGVQAVPPLYTLELCPKDEIDRDAPLLWLFVRDGEPPRPGLPRLRYRVSVRPAGGRHAVVTACRRWAPDLWLGAERMKAGYEGAPDLKGHRRRTRGTGGRTVTPAP